MVGCMRWVRELPGVTRAAVDRGAWVGTTGAWGLGWGAVGSEGSALGLQQSCSSRVVCAPSCEVIKKKHTRFCFREKTVSERKPPATASHGK